MVNDNPYFRLARQALGDIYQEIIQREKDIIQKYCQRETVTTIPIDYDASLSDTDVVCTRCKMGIVNLFAYHLQPKQQQQQQPTVVNNNKRRKTSSSSSSRAKQHGVVTGTQNKEMEYRFYCCRCISEMSVIETDPFSWTYRFTRTPRSPL